MYRSYKLENTFPLSLSVNQNMIVIFCTFQKIRKKPVIAVSKFAINVIGKDFIVL
jgi:hypothetical protein